MAAFSSWRRCLGCFPSWKSSSLTAAIKDRNSPTRWQKFFRISTLKSSGDPTPQSASRSYLNAGSSNAPSLGSIAAGGSPRIGRTSIARRLHSCASLQFASCSENSVIRPKLSGQTLRTVPPEVIDRARVGFIDTVGVMLAGSREDVSHLVCDMVKLEGSTPAATVVGQSFRASPQLAALANGVAAHAMDYDFTFLSGQSVSPVIPAILPVAETTGATPADALA